MNSSKKKKVKKENKKPPQEHITDIYNEYAINSRVIRSFTNLSNTVIQTALSGQSKFIFEILQNADDSFDEEHKAIEVRFILQDNYLIVQHNGKGFDYNDVERICDYASQIEEVKGNDLSKTGYKGLGFKSLFNLSDCIYIHSNGYSFRFDKTHWHDPSNRPWQVIPIWCPYDALPLNQIYSYDQSVNFILKINYVDQLAGHLQDLVDRPELLLFLNRISKLGVSFNGYKHYLERKIETFGLFRKVDIYNNQSLESTWLLITYTQTVPKRIRGSILGGSLFIYPDKIKHAKEVPFTFALKSNETVDEISNIRGLCHTTLPTQLHLMLPYHMNSFFILNLDRTQLHENEWNEFLISQIGYLQFSLLKDLAEMPYLKNYVISLFVRKIEHSYTTFTKAFLKGFEEAKNKVAWLPSYEGSRLLRLGEAWIDKTKFFKQNFQSVRDEFVYPRIIDYDVREQRILHPSEAKAFTFDILFKNFPTKYYQQLTYQSYLNFISYLYNSFKSYASNFDDIGKLKAVPFLVRKDKTLVCPKEAVIEEPENPIPDFAKLNPVDNDYLPSDDISLIKEWLVRLGAKRLNYPVQILKESVLKWLNLEDFDLRITKKNHIQVINFLAENSDQLREHEYKKLKHNMVILTAKDEFKLAKECYFPDAVSISELADVIPDDEKISSCYDLEIVRNFFVHIGVIDKLEPIDVLRKSVLKWIHKGEINHILTEDNYIPIIEYFSQPSLICSLTEKENNDLKKMPVLTCDKKFSRAQNCFFDTAVPMVKGFESVIAKNRLVSTQGLSDNVYEFLKRVGVSEEIPPTEVLKRSILHWINEGTIQYNITLDNHNEILVYIAEQWDELIYSSSTCLGQNVLESLRKIPVKTNCNTLRAACECYWPPGTKHYYEEIPGLLSVIPPDEFVSLEYPKKIQNLLAELGVRDLTFPDVYEKYTNHLRCHENISWFFFHLKNYWKKKSPNYDKLLNYVQKKFKNNRCLRGTNGKMCFSTELYSTQFQTMHTVDPDSLPFLDCEPLPHEMEKWLGFRQELDITCIMKLLEALRRGSKLGEEKTKIFFSTLLDQLRLKEKNEIKHYKFSLLSQDNTLKPAKDLYYFREEQAVCYLDSLYLKRIHGMPHKDTLELAELCGVNVLAFEQEIKFGTELISDDSLKEFYLERLPFFVIQESKRLNEADSVILGRLYNKICSIECFKCRDIFIQYPFGKPHPVENHLEGLEVYTKSKWRGMNRSTIHDHLYKELDFKTDIRKILDMELTSEDREEWLRYKNESPERLLSIEKELQELCSKKEKLVAPCQNDNINQFNPSDGEENLFVSEESDEDKSLSAESSSDESLPDILAKVLPTLPIVSIIEGEETTVRDTFDGWRDTDSYASSSSEDEVLAELVEQEPEIINDCSKIQTVSKDVDWPLLEEAMKSSEILHSHSSSVSNLNTTETVASEKQSKSNRLDEMQLFTFLHDCYKIKYPNSQCNLSGGIFIIRWQPSDKKGIIIEEEGHEDILDIEARWQTRSETESDDDWSSYYIQNKTSKLPVTPDSLFSSSNESFNIKSAENINDWKTTVSKNDDWPLLEEAMKFSKENSKKSSKKDSKKSFKVDEDLHAKRLGEEYVFDFLQDYYKNKYPNAESHLLGGVFTLEWQETVSIQVTWLNESGEKGRAYDLLLKKDGEVKRLIEVESTNVVNNNALNLNHHEFVKRIKCLRKYLLPQHREKYCIYRVFCVDNSATTDSNENLNRQLALYKVVPLKVP